MSYFNDIPGLNVMLLMVLAFITMGFTILLLVTISNAWRLRNPLLSWHSGKIKGYPLFAGIFLIVVCVGILITDGFSSELLPVWVCYGWIGTSWFISSYMMSKRFITDYGVVKNINDPAQTVSWVSITDYFEKQLQNGSVFTFFYLQNNTDNHRHVVRLEIFVPSGNMELMKKIISFKIGNNRRYSETLTQQIINRDALH